jgi:TLC domain
MFTMYGTPSYMTMNFHHFSTIFAIVISYLSNLEEFGILVLILSDASDAVLNFAKTSRDLVLFTNK